MSQNPPIGSGLTADWSFSTLPKMWTMALSNNPLSYVLVIRCMTNLKSMRQSVSGTVCKRNALSVIQFRAPSSYWFLLIIAGNKVWSPFVRLTKGNLAINLVPPSRASPFPHFIPLLAIGAKAPEGHSEAFNSAPREMVRLSDTVLIIGSAQSVLDVLERGNRSRAIGIRQYRQTDNCLH